MALPHMDYEVFWFLEMMHVFRFLIWLIVRVLPPRLLSRWPCLIPLIEHQRVYVEVQNQRRMLQSLGPLTTLPQSFYSGNVMVRGNWGNALLSALNCSPHTALTPALFFRLASLRMFCFCCLWVFLFFKFTPGCYGFTWLVRYPHKLAREQRKKITNLTTI